MITRHREIVSAGYNNGVKTGSNTIPTNAVPTDIASVTPAWVSTQMGRQIGPIRIEPVGAGYMSDVYRVEWQTDALEPNPVSSLVLKLSAEPGVRRAVAESFGSYAKESRFYQAFAAQTGVRVPKCYFNLLDNAGNFALGLEDLTSIPAVSNTSGATLPQTRLAMETLARLHARYWRDLPATVPDFLSGFTPAAETLAAIKPEALFKSPGASNLMACYMEDSMRHLPGFLEQPQVFSHMDYRLDNLKFNEAELILLDWGELSGAPPGFDIANFLVTSVTAENRQAWEREALTCYLSHLHQQGIEYHEADLLASYQSCLPSMVYLPVLVSRTDQKYAGNLLNRLESALLTHLPTLSRIYQK